MATAAPLPWCVCHPHMPLPRRGVQGVPEGVQGVVEGVPRNSAGDMTRFAKLHACSRVMGSRGSCTGRVAGQGWPACRPAWLPPRCPSAPSCVAGRGWGRPLPELQQRAELVLKISLSRGGSCRRVRQHSGRHVRALGTWWRPGRAVQKQRKPTIAHMMCSLCGLTGRASTAGKQASVA